MSEIVIHLPYPDRSPHAELAMRKEVAEFIGDLYRKTPRTVKSCWSMKPTAIPVGSINKMSGTATEYKRVLEVRMIDLEKLAGLVKLRFV